MNQHLEIFNHEADSFFRVSLRVSILFSSIFIYFVFYKSKVIEISFF